MNEEEILKCYLVVETTMFEGYNFRCSKVFININDAESYIALHDKRFVFVIKELELID
jgi:hypothetical protein